MKIDRFVVKGRNFAFFRIKRKENKITGKAWFSICRMFTCVIIFRVCFYVEGRIKPYHKVKNSLGYLTGFFFFPLIQETYVRSKLMFGASDKRDEASTNLAKTSQIQSIMKLFAVCILFFIIITTGIIIIIIIKVIIIIIIIIIIAIIII